MTDMTRDWLHHEAKFLLSEAFTEKFNTETSERIGMRIITHYIINSLKNWVFGLGAL